MKNKVYEIRREFWPFVLPDRDRHVIGQAEGGGYAVYKPVFDDEVAAEFIRSVKGSFMAKTADMVYGSVPPEEELD